MTARRHRRDFILDGGAVSALARDRTLLRTYLYLVDERSTSALLIPIPVFTEVRSAQRSSNVLLDRLLVTLGPSRDRFAPLTFEAANRAGVLRALTATRTGQDISATDAQVVAIAEERSLMNAITIVTGDPDDITALVQTTGRTNIAVDPV